MKAAISTVLVLLACVFRVTAQQSSASQPTMFVAPLEGDASQVMGWQPALGDGLAEMLITELSKLGKFQMVESTALKDLAEEIKLGESGYVNQQEKVDKGGWAGADFMFRGKVTRFGSNQNKVGLGGFVPGQSWQLGR